MRSTTHVIVRSLVPYINPWKPSSHSHKQESVHHHNTQSQPLKLSQRLCPRVIDQMAPKLAALALAVLLAATVVAPPTAVRAAVSCATVYSNLMPCLGYVQSGSAMPTPSCCGGIRSLLSQANNTPDRRTVCNCLKNVANGASGSSNYITRAAGLPGKCGVTLPYKISANVNCNTIN
ncbi:hypothetical protein EJB05_18587 [Eragrostis curvula]|uniref:Non-specific lipid-transfer protein n=1 Tax=Eragrostis curvula TaxID=38414 RepID=A0A5J9VM94_9POAL|nr:hypothetical protein EJB05_18587 [Eragrostis curvula]